MEQALIIQVKVKLNKESGKREKELDGLEEKITMMQVMMIKVEKLGHQYKKQKNDR